VLSTYKGDTCSIHARGGRENIGDLTNRGIKSPTAGARSVKSPTPSRGFESTSRITSNLVHTGKIKVSAILLLRNTTAMKIGHLSMVEQEVISNPHLGVWGHGS